MFNVLAKIRTIKYKRNSEKHTSINCCRDFKIVALNARTIRRGADVWNVNSSVPHHCHTPAHRALPEFNYLVEDHILLPPQLTDSLTSPHATFLPFFSVAEFAIRKKSQVPKKCRWTQKTKALEKLVK
ncbi:hypothetical protein AVEN_151664-1 [Araneus ventricosus]|uniref:Uncharacterized protein n=1 Tax=Araneus ventricosus TaxID=182803 RepID=A0A4Y2JSM2_ARAVE|nr:hypothetical protein AVEN_151664-1 [Araneus ventricosus]